MKLTLAAALGLVTSAMASPMDCDFSKMIQPATASAKFEDPSVIVHYRGGKLIETSSFPLGLPVAFDFYTFGNWADSTRHEDSTVRNFCNFVGCLDEFVNLTRALSSGKID